MDQPIQQPVPALPDTTGTQWDAIKKMLANPGAQSEELLRILQQYFLEKMNSARPTSPLNPNNRPGVTPDALPASDPRGMMTGQ
jgi:hypothetical protein